MALSAKVGNFIGRVSVGSDAITGVGFQPKAVIFFADLRTTDGTSTSGSSNIDMPMCLGIATGASEEAFYAQEDDFTSGAQAAGSGKSMRLYGNGTGGLNCEFDVTSLDADGFTLNYTNVDIRPVLNYLALGGSDLTNAKVLSAGGAPNTIGNVAYTGAGFRPDAIIFLLGLDSTHDRGGWGMAVSSSQRACCSSQYSGGLTRYQRSDKCVCSLTSVLTHEADLVSMDADGFTLNWTTASNLGANNPNLFALCLKGGQYHVATISEKTSNGTKAETGVGFTPKALLFGSVGKTAGTSVASDLINLMFGSTAGTSQRAAVELVDNANAVARLDRAKVLVHTNDSGTTKGEADLSSFDSDGFTLNWTNTDGTARESFYMAFGDTASAGQTILPDADTVTTGWATAPLFSKVNDASDATVITATSS
jgi:hypothetical protein